MSKIDTNLVYRLNRSLEKFDREVYPLPGIADVENKECLISQIMDSIRRVKYISVLRRKPLTGHCANAVLIGFNPITAASWHFRNGNIDEAMWLTFLSTYFGKSKSSGWALTRGFYSNLGSAPAYWTWDRVYNNFGDFVLWLRNNAEELKKLGAFSNHRRYTSFRVDSNTGPISVFSNYLEWVGNGGSHELKIQSIVNKATELDQPVFKVFYNSIPSGMSLARLGKFDYLTMLSKLGIVDMIADSTYMTGATGPKSGAKLLFWGSTGAKVSNKEIEKRMDTLARYLNIEHGMQIIEDSVCNWQKYPDRYTRFTG